MARQVITFEDGWPKIREAIDRLQASLDQQDSSAGVASGEGRRRKLFATREYMDIYTRCYNMCTQRPPHNCSGQLYQAHGDCIDNYLLTVVRDSLVNKHGEVLLRELGKRWANHLIMNKWLFRFFTYLDRYYVDQHSQPKLKDAGLAAFRRLFCTVVDDVVAAAMEVVNKHRDGETVEHSLVKRVVEILETLGQSSLDFYRKVFEPRVLTATVTYYRSKAGEWMDVTTPEYLRLAETALEGEANRIMLCFHRTSKRAIMKAAETELLAKHESALLENSASGVLTMLRNDKFDDLARAFRLFSRVPNGLKTFGRLFKTHVQEQGLAIVRQREAAIAAANGKESSSDPTFVRALLELHDKTKKLVETQFQGNSLFQKMLKDAFELFVNKEVQSKYTSAEMISAFCDRILKTGGARLSESQVEDLLSRVVQLFTFISDKDLFALHYRNALSKRLLNQRSASADAERSMISKLKLRCGAQFTGKMEGMLADLQVGVDHVRKLKAYIAEQDSKPPFEFTVQVLTTGYWPTYKAIQVALPPVVTQCHATFRAYYDTVTAHRKLQWVHALGTAIVKGRFPAGVKDLQVTTLQMVVLLFFNDHEGEVGFTDIRTALNLQDEVCKRILHSLSCGKYKLLKKAPKSRSINTTDTFTFNKGFKCPFRKVRIPMASLEDSGTTKNVKQDRSIAIEAAAVRIMKARRVLPHQELIMEIIAQLHFFRPNPKVIKRRIETLIEREYLERDPDNSHVYRYLA